ncbi:MAG TPA: molybdopterin-dependent oxidoreductase [Candidatus Eisenbacteria bacterium]|nr:molybdopterin-dependent oxidoreductase [Candidatus Eisenbacteria bacterium]
MSEPVVFNRRDFLRLVGVGVAGAAAGCAPPADKLIPYLVAPNDIMPGVAYWYASTCTECPAGCGVLVKAREGRAIKVEGNPKHPVNLGGLCARGQAGLQGLYDPDRIRTPLRKEGGAWKAITWDEALQLASSKVNAAATGRRGITLMTGHVTGSLQRLAREWAEGGSASHMAYEPFAHESLREANRRTFGRAEIPDYDFARARCVVSFGADFLETWLSPVGYARGFAAMRARRDGAGTFVAVEPRLSLTGTNADEWVAIRPGTEAILALGMAQVILAEGLAQGADRGALADAVSSFTPDVVAQQTEVPAETVQRLARLFASQRPSLAVAGGIAAQSEQSVALCAAVNLLNHAAGNVGETVRFERGVNFDGVASFADLQKLIADMTRGAVEVLVVHGANPAYAAPAWAGFPAAMDKVPFKISLSGVMDETTQRCDLVLPATHALETIGDAEPGRGVHAIQQPAMQRVPTFDARPAGETLIAIARGAGFGDRFPETWAAYVKARWQPMHQRFGAGRDFDTYWGATLEAGGQFEPGQAAAVRWSGTPAFAVPELKGAGDLALVLYPSTSLFDGRGANKAWLQELPDPTSKVVWGSWVEIHPETAAKLKIAQGDAVKVETEAGSVELPAYLYGGLRKDVIAIPLGQGHSAYGRYAEGRGVNPAALLSPAQDGASGAVAYLSARAKVARATQAADLVMTQREKGQFGREIAQIIPIAAILGGTANGHGAAEAGGHHEVPPSQTKLGKHTTPLEPKPGARTPAHAITAYEPIHKARGPRNNPIDKGSYARAEHRWAMAIDLDSCTGCSACVVACSAENNVPSVGPELVKRGREMMWIRLDRYEESLEPGRVDVRHMPMMCQHCGDAPCETVCPVYATYHNPEGLNAQVYNRCVGTRYCSNNCPYKVRAFNFFDYAAPEKATFAFPEPLNWQLNPDVTVRNKGVMEKCTMCIQRILEAKGIAKDEERPLRDGEFQTACAQSCPTQAIVFGDLADDQSAVHKASHGERRYWVFNELNTKPGVTYLKRVRRDAGAVQEPTHG